MAFSLILMSKLASMMLWAVIAFAFVRAGILSPDDSKPLSKLLAYTMTPAAIIRSFQVDFTQERFFGLISGFILAMVMHLLWLLAARLLARPLHLTGVDQASLIYSNCGNLIVPLIIMILGEEYVFYTASYVVIFTLLAWTHGASLIRGQNGMDLRKALLNPNILAIPVGLILFFTGWQLPDIADTALQGLQNSIGPVSMFIIGIIFAGVDMKGVFTDKKSYLISLGRLIVFPVMMIVLLYLSRIIVIWPSLRSVFLISMLAAAAPTANTVAQIAIIYDREAVPAGIYNVMTTILCIVTMPAVIWLYQVLL